MNWCGFSVLQRPESAMIRNRQPSEQRNNDDAASQRAETNLGHNSYSMLRIHQTFKSFLMGGFN
jgi:hypothetical protein